MNASVESAAAADAGCDDPPGEYSGELSGESTGGRAGGRLGKSSGGHALSVVVTCEGCETDAGRDGWLLGTFKRCCAAVGVSAGEITLVLVDDMVMSTLHEQYSSVTGTTDVLTFDHRDDPGDADEPMLADLVLCVEEASRQSAARGHAVREELLLYAVHGLMHLLGEDDHEPSAYERMHEREDMVLRSVGLGGVFARGQGLGEAKEARR
jgi:probable rRNA maturation factor